MSPILFNLYGIYRTKDSVEGFGELRIGGRIIVIVKYAYDLVLQVKEETVLQSMIARLI